MTESALESFGKQFVEAARAGGVLETCADGTVTVLGIDLRDGPVTLQDESRPGHGARLSLVGETLQVEELTDLPMLQDVEPQDVGGPESGDLPSADVYVPKAGPAGPERRYLVCEGVCNPGLKMLDRRVSEYRRIEYTDSRTYTPMADERIVADLRALIHTPHEIRTKSRLGPSTWVCTVCSASKVF